MARLRIVNVSRELLAAMLHLPEGAKIIDATTHLRFTADEVSFKVECDSFPEVPDGNHIPPLLGEFSLDEKTNRVVVRWEDV